MMEKQEMQTHQAQEPVHQEEKHDSNPENGVVPAPFQNEFDKQSIMDTWFADMGEVLATEMCKSCLKLRNVAERERP